MPRRATGWSGFSAVLLLILPVLTAPAPSTPASTQVTLAQPFEAVAVDFEVARVPFEAVAAGIDPLLADAPDRPFVEARPPDPTPAVRVEARTRAVSAPAAPPVPVGPSAAVPAGPGSSLRLSQSEVYDLTLEVSGDADWAVWATRVIMCESGGQVNAVSPGGHYGLAQVATMHPYDFSRMVTEPRYAVQAMVAIYQSSGPGAWSCK